VPKETWIELLNHCKAKGDQFSYFLHTVEFCVLRVGLKYISLDMLDEALHLAFRINSQPLLAVVK